jgi:D-alanine-D-alanine ligase
MKNVAIIEGGYSHEKIISLQSAETVFQNVDRTLYNPIKVRIDEKGWFAFVDNERIEVNRNDFSFMDIKFDVAFIVIHGTPGEDGKLQAYFDMLGIPYTTCSHFAATLTFNKFACNRYLKTFGIKVAEAILVRKDEEFDVERIVKELGLPCFVKPNDGGSSFGVTKVENKKDLTSAIQLALSHGTQAIIESFMSGREVTNGIYRGTKGVVPLPITEIVTANGFFDFDAKYKGESDEITPADLPQELTNKVKAVTKEIFELLDLKGIARADFIIQGDEPYLIEVNTVPGMSDASLIPQMAEHDGITLKDMFNEVMEVALIR